MSSSSSSSSSGVGDRGGDRSMLEESKREMIESGNLNRDEYNPIGGLTSFNAEYGYLEAIVRGFKSGFLKSFEVSLSRHPTSPQLLDRWPMRHCHHHHSHAAINTIV